MKSGVPASEVAGSLAPEGKQSLPFVEGAKQFLKGESGQSRIPLGGKGEEVDILPPKMSDLGKEALRKLKGGKSASELSLDVGVSMLFHGYNQAISIELPEEARNAVDLVLQQTK